MGVDSELGGGSESLWEEARRRGITRRRFLALLAIGGAGAVLAACAARPGLPRPSSLSMPPTPTAPTLGQTAPATPHEPTPTQTTPARSAAPTSNPTTTQSPPPSTSGLPADLSGANPAQVDNSHLPITPVEGIGVIGAPPEVDIGAYLLSVGGLVNTPLTLSYHELLQRPTITEVCLLICSGFFAANVEWTGVPVSSFLDQATVRPEAAHIVVYSMDGDLQSFALADIDWDGFFLAHTLNGQTLPKEHGYPVRLVDRGKYGNLWVKWVNRIELT